MPKFSHLRRWRRIKSFMTLTPGWAWGLGKTKDFLTILGRRSGAKSPHFFRRRERRSSVRCIFRVWADVIVIKPFFQGTLTEGKGSVQLASFELISIDQLLLILKTLFNFTEKVALMKRPTALSLPLKVSVPCLFVFRHWCCGKITSSLLFVIFSLVLYLQVRNCMVLDSGKL